MAVKRENKERLAKAIFDSTGVRVTTDALFDVQVKRLHEYKRQLLHVFGVIDEYFRIVEDGQTLTVPRVHVFAGKAAPGYYMAKLIIKLINNVAAVINRDPRVGDSLKVVFMPDYRVSLAEIIVPAADLSEQISTAGMEASGTSNMKFAMNGALTIGTLDGANVEMRSDIGAENMFIFGNTVEQVRALKSAGYCARHWYDGNPRVRRAIDALTGPIFSVGEGGIFVSIYDALMAKGDYYLNIADMPAYLEAQELASQCYQDAAQWSSKAILNVSRTGGFSSDRTIREYAAEIWGIKPVLPELG